MKVYILIIKLTLLISVGLIEEKVIRADLHSTDVLTTDHINFAVCGNSLITISNKEVILTNYLNGNITKYKLSGRGPGEIGTPWDVDVDENYIYIYDLSNNKILKFDHNLSYTDEFLTKGIGLKGFSVMGDESIMSSKDNEFILSVENMEDNTVKRFHKNIIPTGYQPSAFNSAVFEVYSSNIYVKYRAIDSLYVYNKKTLQLNNTMPITVNYEEDYGNPPVVAFKGVFDKPIIIPFSEFKVYNEDTLFGVIEGYVYILKKKDGAYVEKAKYILVDSNNYKIYVDNLDFNSKYLFIYSRSIDKIVKYDINKINLFN